jgi:hypothetical protein
MSDCDCPDCREERVYEPLRLTCKTTEQAEAFAVILTGMGAPIPPYVQGDVVVIPWGGAGRFVNGLIDFAGQAKVAEPEQVRDLSYQAMSQTMGTDVENVRTFGSRLVDVVSEFMGTIGSSAPPDVIGILGTLDQDLDNLHDPGE